MFRRSDIPQFMQNVMNIWTFQASMMMIVQNFTSILALLDVTLLKKKT
jgi:hypothetical protein